MALSSSKKLTAVAPAQSRKVTDYFNRNTSSGTKSQQASSSSPPDASKPTGTSTTSGNKAQPSSSNPQSSQSTSSQATKSKYPFPPEAKPSASQLASQSKAPIASGRADEPITISSNTSSSEESVFNASRNAVRPADSHVLSKATLKRSRASSDLVNTPKQSVFDRDVIEISSTDEAPAPSAANRRVVSTKMVYTISSSSSDSDVHEVSPPNARAASSSSTFSRATMAPSSFYSKSNLSFTTLPPEEPITPPVSKPISPKRSSVKSRKTSLSSPKKKKNSLPSSPRSGQSSHSSHVSFKTAPAHIAPPFKRLRLSDHEDETVESSQDDEREISGIMGLGNSSDGLSFAGNDMDEDNSMDWIPSPPRESHADRALDQDPASLPPNAIPSPSPFAVRNRVQALSASTSSKVLSDSEAALPSPASTSAAKKSDAETDKTLVSDHSNGDILSPSARFSDGEVPKIILRPGWDQDDSDDLGESDLDKALGLKAKTTITAAVQREKNTPLSIIEAAAHTLESDSSLTEEESHKSSPIHNAPKKLSVTSRAGSSPTPPPESAYYASRKSSRVPAQPPSRYRIAAPKAPGKKQLSGIEALLKDKERNEKKYGGDDIFRVAEEVLKKRDAALNNPVSPETKQKTLKVPRTPRRSRNSSSSSSATNSDDLSGSEASPMDEAEDEIEGQLPDDEDGEALKVILKKDRDEKAQKVTVKKGTDVKFWQKTDSKAALAPTITLPLPKIESATQTYSKLLQHAASQNDLTQVRVLLNATRLNAINSVEDKRSLVKWLLELAVVHSDVFLADLAFHCLISLFHDANVARDALSFEFIFSVTAKLGPKREMLELFKGGANQGPRAYPGTKKMRNDGIYRFARIIGSAAQAGVIQGEDIPHTVLLLVLLSVDPSCRPEVQEVNDNAVERLLASPTVTPQTELAILALVARRGSSLSAGQKLNIVSHMRACGPVSLRLSKWIALGMLYPKQLDNIDHFDYVIAPPIQDIQLALSNTENIFEVSAERGADFQALAHNVDILSVILKDVELYDTVIVRDMEASLKFMWGSIMDTRAAHMDRTRAKESLQCLGTRLHYQTRAAVDKKPNGLRNYFTKT